MLLAGALTIAPMGVVPAVSIDIPAPDTVGDADAGAPMRVVLSASAASVDDTDDKTPGLWAAGGVVCGEGGASAGEGGCAAAEDVQADPLDSESAATASAAAGADSPRCGGSAPALVPAAGAVGASVGGAGA